MENLIRLLPEAVANQIAAGEVIQRPASAVKELLENSVDAGATRIEVHVRDAGRSMIRIIDNGMGMNPHDARMAFERHATSKLKSAEDLFNIRTKGFRGEALASIASVAQVELKTRLHNADLGTSILIEGSNLINEESCQTSPGTSITVKNLFQCSRPKEFPEIRPG
jgi:DNA mismatch repair protein MutL